MFREVEMKVGSCDLCRFASSRIERRQIHRCLLLQHVRWRYGGRSKPFAKGDSETGNPHQFAYNQFSLKEPCGRIGPG